jgi:mono/diheme cytochrome c family protein
MDRQTSPGDEEPVTGLIRQLIFLALVSLAMAACGSGSDPDTMEGPEIPVQDADLVATGEPLYQANCASCHGTDLRGTDQGPPHLSIVYAPDHHGDQAFVLATKFGVQAHHWPYGPMQPVEGLSDDDITAIIAYVRESQRLNGFEPYPPN